MEEWPGRLAYLVATVLAAPSAVLAGMWPHAVADVAVSVPAGLGAAGVGGAMAIAIG
ncbi:hypothetical protein [Nonomuraea sp. bgisy101]|uniref:hypothetical protein n=1 Tax=Nonomuraea sp. bgisy101 TaxID=3413784 RepID=UPI003D758BCA